MNSNDGITNPGPETTTIPWYQSQIIRRLALSIAVQILAATHLAKYFTGVNLSVLVDDLLEAVGIAYAAWALHGRVTKPVPPVALTKAKADIANAPSIPPFVQPPPENRS